MELLDASTITAYNWNDSPHVAVIAPARGWAESTPEVSRLQMRVVPRFDSWAERCRLLFDQAPDDLREKVQEKSDQVRDWLARDDRTGGWSSRWDLPETIEEAKEKQARRFQELRQLFEVVAGAETEGRIIGVPDTSALIDESDLRRYVESIGPGNVDLFLVAPVLSELDNLKDQGKTSEVRAHAREAIAAIKRIRELGRLADGVEIAPGLRVFSRPSEPKFEALPGQLDPSVVDDRILGAAFELQRSSPNAAVVLITSDINLQTKADVAELPFVEPPS